ncbi:MAG: FimV/HubP family polar landmark protein, partial [Psychromonas sp.]
DALIAADMQVSTTGSNANNETLTETASTDNSGNVMPVQLAVMQDELNRVNSQLVDTIAINQDLKSGLHLLINEIDLLKNQINSESAAQSNLLKLIEQYGIELNASQNPAFNKTAVNNQVVAWVTASSTNLLMAVALPLLVVILIFSLLLRRNNRKLLAEKNKLIALTVAPDSDSKSLPLSDNSHSLEDHSQQTEKAGFAVSPDAKSEDLTSNRNKIADELGYYDLTFLVSDAEDATAEVPFNEQAQLAADDFIVQPNVTDTVTDNGTGNVAGKTTKSVTEQCNDTQTDDKLDADDQLPELTRDEFSSVFLFEHATASKTEQDASEIDTKKSTAEFSDTEKKQAEVVNNSSQPTQSSAALKLRNSENYIAIETLLQNSDGDNPDEIYTDLNIDLGLDAFSGMLSADPDIDIDDDAYGISAKLDLARAYLEIDDKARAKAILVALVENSNAQQRNEIDKLLTRF